MITKISVSVQPAKIVDPLLFFTEGSAHDESSTSELFEASSD
jgi:hypothetical protein